jgi:hypothetical protein
MLALATLFFTALLNTVAQQPPPEGPPPQGPPAQMAPQAPMQRPLEDGPCLDSARGVPRVVAAPVSRGMQIVRIDQVLSTSTMMPGEVIGFLYTTQNGSSWLGERSAQYTSPADATAINRVLASTHVPGQNVNAFPPQSHYGVATHSPQIFQVSIPGDAMSSLRIATAPCVAWPADRPLPDPAF